MITARSQSLEIKNQLYQVTSDIGIISRKLMVLLNSKLLYTITLSNCIESILLLILIVFQLNRIHIWIT